MEKKINIAELLKDCPKGMELDCTIWDNVKFDHIDMSRDYPIYITIEGNGCEQLTKYGQFDSRHNAKCVIFPKGKTTWEGFQRPFKDGVVLVHTQNDRFIMSIYKSNKNEQLINTHAILWDREEGLSVGMQICCYTDNVRLATEEEKERLFDAIKANGYKWNEETKTLEKLIEPKFKVGDRIKEKQSNIIGEIIDVQKNKYNVRIDDKGLYMYFREQDNWELVHDKFDINTLKPFQKVLVRDSDKEYWCINFFGFYNEITKQFHCMGNTDIGWDECIPYTGNEHLLGTNNDCSEYYKTWK